MLLARYVVTNELIPDFTTLAFDSLLADNATDNLGDISNQTVISDISPV